MRKAYGKFGDLSMYLKPESYARLPVPFVGLPRVEVREFRIEQLSVAFQRSPSTGDLRIIARMRVPSVDDGRVIDVICSEAIAETFAEQYPLQAVEAARRQCVRALTHELDEKFFVNGARYFDPHEGDDG